MTVWQEIRLELGLHQREMAELVGVDQTTVSRWERGLAEPWISQFAVIRRYALKRFADWDDDAIFKKIKPPR